MDITDDRGAVTEHLRLAADPADRRNKLMVWLSIAGGVFLVWVVLVFLFTPAIPYHLSQRTSVSARRLSLHIQSTCQAALHHGNRVTILTDGPVFYAAMLEAIRGATRSINMECYIFHPGRMADGSSTR